MGGGTTGIKSTYILYKDVLILEWKLAKVLHWGHGFACIYTGNKKLWIPSKLAKIRIGQENLGHC